MFCLASAHNKQYKQLQILREQLQAPKFLRLSEEHALAVLQKTYVNIVPELVQHWLFHGRFRPAKKESPGRTSTLCRLQEYNRHAQAVSSANGRLMQVRRGAGSHTKSSSSSHSIVSCGHRRDQVPGRWRIAGSEPG